MTCEKTKRVLNMKYEFKCRECGNIHGKYMTYSSMKTSKVSCPRCEGDCHRTFNNVPTLGEDSNTDKRLSIPINIVEPCEGGYTITTIRDKTDNRK